MAAKKKVVKKASKNLFDGEYGVELDRVMSSSEIKKAQKLLSDIGSGKVNGFIGLFEYKKGVRGATAEGVMFIKNMSPHDLVGTLIRNSGIDEDVYLGVLREIILSKISKLTPKHRHDQDGNCI